MKTLDEVAKWKKKNPNETKEQYVAFISSSIEQVDLICKLCGKTYYSYPNIKDDVCNNCKKQMTLMKLSKVEKFWVMRSGWSILESIKNIQTERCDICNYKRCLEIHHIDGNKKNNSVDNLISLCYNCHYSIHYYKKSIQELREEVMSVSKKD